MKTKVITTDGQLREPEAPNTHPGVHKFFDFLIGHGWIIHRLDEDLVVVALLRVDAPKSRNLHAEVLIRTIGIPGHRVPKLYGDAVFMGLRGNRLSRKTKLRSLPHFHDQLISSAFSTMEEAGV